MSIVVKFKLEANFDVDLVPLGSFNRLFSQRTLN